MKTIKILSFIGLLSLVVTGKAHAATVSNQDYIRKKIDFLSEDADHSYDKIRSAFSITQEFTAQCFKENPGRRFESVDPVFIKYMPVPRVYNLSVHRIEKGLGFDLYVHTEAERLGLKTETFNSLGEYGALGLMECVSSKTGCGSLTFNSSKSLVQILNGEEKQIKLIQDWVLYFENEKLSYGSLSVSFAKFERNFIGSKTGIKRYEEKFLCVLD